MLDEEELDAPPVPVVDPEELDEELLVALDAVVPVVAAPVVAVAVALVVDAAVVDIPPEVADVAPVVPVVPVVAAVGVPLVLVFTALLLDVAAGSSEEQATNETPTAHVVSRREAMLSFLIVIDPEAAPVTLFGNPAPG